MEAATDTPCTPEPTPASSHTVTEPRSQHSYRQPAGSILLAAIPIGEQRDRKSVV